MLQLTARPVLSGFVPGVTVAVIVTTLPGVAGDGVTWTCRPGLVDASAAAFAPPKTVAARMSASKAKLRNEEFTDSLRH
jgi:hypothetical protein